ncbi:MAG: hypothetical protein R3288_05340 [Woeseiaceae bacterium]|nr:hypothetical protein [Woeseiaceae bacterium]
MATVSRIASRPAATLVLVSLMGCGDEPAGPDAAIRAWVDAMHSAAEDKDRGEIVARISPAYRDARGHDRDDIDRLLRFYFLRQNRVEFVPRIEAITVFDGSAAEVSLVVAMAGTSERALGFSADAYRFELELAADGDDWTLISARWGELGQALQ